MDRRERADDLNVTLLAALDGWQTKIWTALPAIVQSFDPVAMTAVLQPTIQASIIDQAGVQHWITLPLLPDVPVVFPGGGGFTLTFPVAAGDEALVVIASRCIDAWWAYGQVQVQAEFRMHNLSDGFALVGVRSRPRVLASVSTTAAQLRSDDGAMRLELAAGNVLNIVAPGGVNITGNVAITGTLQNNGVNVGSTHVHGGVDPGGSNTAGPS